MQRSRWAWIVLLAVAVAAFCAAVCVPGLQTGVLFLAPAIVLLASLAAGHYLGEDRLARLAAAFRPRRRRRRGAIAVAALRCVRLMPRGGRLVGACLAVRPPPAAPVVR
jgi:hypothetical protein